MTSRTAPESTLSTAGSVGLRQVFSTWWPLAASWLMMGLELPAVSAFMARFPDPNINLAAYGGIVFPIALVVEAPIIMLLAASTALCRDRASYLRIRRFMFWAAGALTLVHLLIVATPLYSVLVARIIGAPAEIHGPGRTGLLIMTPWTAAIAYRRFEQGVLIRFGHSSAVGAGTMVRLLANLTVLVWAKETGAVSGIVAGTTAVSVGVVMEAIVIGFWVRPILRGPLRDAPPVSNPPTIRSFLSFYVPLALTSLLTLLILPILSSALSRMPRAIDSLATWPVASGLVFVLQAIGLAYSEVVVSLLDRPGSARALFRFMILIAATTTVVLGILAVTPLGWYWFHRVSALEEPLARLGMTSLWLALFLPALSVIQSWFQGILVVARRTRGVTEAVLLFLVAASIVLGIGIRHPQSTGIYVGFAAMLVGRIAQNLWLFYRSRQAVRAASDTGNPRQWNHLQLP